MLGEFVGGFPKTLQNELPEFFDNDPKVLCLRIPTGLMEVERDVC